MALAPTDPASDPSSAAIPMADPTAGAAPDTGDSSDTVLVTIASAPDGGYIVYSGDEPDAGEGEGESADDAAAAGPGAGGAPGADAGSSGGQHCDSIGAALKAAMDILKEGAASAGAPGTADDQFASGFGADQSPTPASGKGGRGMKFPPAAT